MYILGLDHIVLCVKDVDETLRFYERVLGMGPARNGRAWREKGGHAIGVAPKRKVSERWDRACAPQANWFLGAREQRLFSIGGSQQCERLQISISITPPRTPGIFLTRDSGITCCADV